MNPIANTAVFVSLSSDLDDRERVRDAITAAALLLRMTLWLGDAGLTIVRRLLGPILVIIGVQLLIAGVYDAVSNFNAV